MQLVSTALQWVEFTKRPDVIDNVTTDFILNSRSNTHTHMGAARQWGVEGGGGEP